MLCWRDLFRHPPHFPADSWWPSVAIFLFIGAKQTDLNKIFTFLEFAQLDCGLSRKTPRFLGVTFFHCNNLQFKHLVNKQKSVFGDASANQRFSALVCSKTALILTAFTVQTLTFWSYGSKKTQVLWATEADAAG